MAEPTREELLIAARAAAKRMIKRSEAEMMKVLDKQEVEGLRAMLVFFEKLEKENLIDFSTALASIKLMH